MHEFLASGFEESEEEFRALAEAMPQFVWIARPDGTIDYFNTPWVNYTGLTVERMKAQGTKGVVHPDERAATLKQWRDALATGAPYEIEYRLRRVSDDSYRWFIARAAPVRNSDGRIYFSALARGMLGYRLAHAAHYQGLWPVVHIHDSLDEPVWIFERAS